MEENEEEENRTEQNYMEEGTRGGEENRIARKKGEERNRVELHERRN